MYVCILGSFETYDFIPYQAMRHFGAVVEPLRFAFHEQAFSRVHNLPDAQRQGVGWRPDLQLTDSAYRRLPRLSDYDAFDTGAATFFMQIYQSPESKPSDNGISRITTACDGPASASASHINLRATRLLPVA